MYKNQTPVSGMLKLGDQNSKHLIDMLRAFMDKVETMQE